MALEQENQRLLSDLQQVSVEKAQHYDNELSETTRSYSISLRQQDSTYQNLPKESKISLLGKFDGIRSQFRGFLNQVR